MNDTQEAHANGSIDLYVYLSLIFLTLITVSSSALEWGRILAVTAALAIAAIKATLIALYYMHLKDEGPLTCAIVLTGLTAVAILAFGILPDMAVYNR